MKNLLELYCMEDTQLHEYSKKKLVRYGYKIIERKGSYLCGIPTDNNIQPILLVAHIDTVHSIKPAMDNFVLNKNILTTNITGIGADDRNGLYTILRMLEKGHRPYILFPHDEEIGGIGVKQFMYDYPKPIGDIKFTIEIDRKGIGEAVFYCCENDEFKKLIHTYGFNTNNRGSYSDIATIMPVWDIAGANLSAGYENAHQQNEYTNLASLDFTINVLNKILIDSHDLLHYDMGKIERPAYTSSYNNRQSLSGYKPQGQSQIFDFEEETYAEDDPFDEEVE